MNFEELVESKKSIGSMSKDELFTYCNGLLDEIWDFEKEIERLKKENKELDKICASKSHYIDKKDLEIGELNYIIEEIKERVLDETKPLPSAKEIIDIIEKDQK